MKHSEVKGLSLAIMLLIAMGHLVFSPHAHAQVGIYLLGSSGRLSGTNVGYGTPQGASGNFTAFGGTLGVYDNFLRLGPVKLGSDLRGFIQHSSNASTAGNEVRGVLVGLRVAASAPLLPVKPYLQGEIGAGSTNFGVNTSRTGSFAYQINGGADFTVLPHVDLRAEYGAGQLNSVLNGNNHQTLQQFGAGVVVRF